MRGREKTLQEQGHKLEKKKKKRHTQKLSCIPIDPGYI